MKFIPLFNTKHTSLSKQHALKQKEILSQKQQRLNLLETLLKKTIANRNTSIIMHQTQLKNMQHIASATQIMLKTYETGTVDFNDVLAIHELQLKFELNMITSVVNYYTESTTINYLIK